MKWFVLLGVLAGAYVWMLMYTTDTVMNQTRALQARYQQAADYADQLGAQQTSIEQTASQQAGQP